MKSSLKLFCAALIGLSPLAARAQQTQILTADKHNEYGLIYTLPITNVEFTVTARHTVHTAGPYYQYAKKYVGSDKAVTADYEEWEILKVEARPVGVPDNENRFLMQLKPGALTSICVADDGMLLAINKEVEAPATGIPESASELKQDVKVREYLQYVNEDFIASQSTAKQAQMLSESLMEIRDAKVSLTRGTAETMPTDGRQLELMLRSLSHQEEAVTAAFMGITAEQTVVRKFTFQPGDNGRSILFRMSDFAGFTDTDDLSGDPAYVNVEITREGELPLNEKGEPKKFPKDGVVYNIPGAAKVTLSLNGRTLWSGEVECSQYGEQFGLAPSLFSDKKERSYATFNPATGALEKIGMANGE